MRRMVGFRRMFPDVSRWEKKTGEDLVLCFNSFKYLFSKHNGEVLKEERRKYFIYDRDTNKVIPFDDSITLNTYAKMFPKPILVLETIERFTAKAREKITGNVYFV